MLVASSIPVIAATPDGGFVISIENDIEKFSSNGQRDFSFGISGDVNPGFISRIEQLVVDDSGNIFATTDDFQSDFFGDSPAEIAKITPNGQIDNSFGNSGIAQTRSIDTEVIVDSQGRLIFGDEIENNLFQLTRINADGSADPDFGFLAFTDDNRDGLRLEIDAFDRVVGVATNTVDRGFDSNLGDTCFETTRTIFRVNADGTFDNTFANNGSSVEQLFSANFGDNVIEDFRLTDDGRLLILEDDRIFRFNV